MHAGAWTAWKGVLKGHPKGVKNGKDSGEGNENENESDNVDDEIKGGWVQVDKVGVHPDNRERTMLVPVDAHDLLLRMCHDGFSRKKCITMAGGIPPTPDGLQ